jgi:hypothetical protein
MVRRQPSGQRGCAEGKHKLRLLPERLQRDPGHGGLLRPLRRRAAVAGVGGDERILPGQWEEHMELLLQRHRPHHHHRPQ